MALLLGLGLCALVPFLNKPDIVTPPEARIALAARQMAACGWPWSGQRVSAALVVPHRGIVGLTPDWDAPPIRVNPWLVPVVSGQVRVQDPPLPCWCAAICFRLFGGFSEFAVRFVPALLGAIAVLLMYDLGRVLYGRRVGWLAGLAWVSTYAISQECRKALPDPYLVFFTLMCVWSWVRAGFGARKGFLVVFYVSFALALLAKGPSAFVGILLPLAVFQVCVKGAMPRPAWAHGAGVLLMLVIAGAWPLYIWKTVPQAMEIWRYEFAGQPTEVATAGWFVLPSLLYFTLPWTALWAAGIARQFFRVRSRLIAWLRRRLLASDRGIEQTAHSHSDLRHFFPLIWYGVMILSFGLGATKKSQYLIPILPAQALIIAQGLAVVLAGARRGRFKRPAKGLIAFQTTVAVAVAIAIIAFLFSSGPPGPLLIAFAITGLIVALLPIASNFRRDRRAWVLVQAVAFVAVSLVFNRVVVTPGEDEQSARQVAGELLDLSQQRGHTLFTRALPEVVAVYLPIDMKYDPDAGHVLVILDDRQGVQERAGNKRGMPIPIPDFDAVIPASRVKGIHQVLLKSAADDARWKVWELTVDRSVFTRAESDMSIDRAIEFADARVGRP